MFRLHWYYSNRWEIEWIRGNQCCCYLQVHSSIITICRSFLSWLEYHCSQTTRGILLHCFYWVECNCVKNDSLKGCIRTAFSGHPISHVVYVVSHMYLWVRNIAATLVWKLSLLLQFCSSASHCFKRPQFWLSGSYAIFPTSLSLYYLKKKKKSYYFLSWSSLKPSICFQARLKTPCCMAYSCFMSSWHWLHESYYMIWKKKDNTDIVNAVLQYNEVRWSFKI